MQALETTTLLNTLAITLLTYEACHFLGDFTHLSTNWMLRAKRLGTPLLPILAHAGVHTTLFFIATFYLHGLDKAILSAQIQLPTHFIIDVLKGKMNYWFPSLQDTSNKFHWLLFGFDQYLHQIVIISTAIIVSY